jgi:CheY-like chemotaxis protein
MLNESTNKIPGGALILLVEDVELNQLLASRIIESWGVHVDIAPNGRVAVEMVMNKMYDLVLMDIQMPEMDGLEATRRIRNLEDENKASVPIVALTANVLQGDGDRYIAAGMNNYLSKPYDEKKLFQIISLNLKNGKMPGESLTVATAEPLQAEKKPCERLYDLSMVSSIAGGDQGFIKKMVQIFLDTMPPSVDQLQNELQQQNWDALSKLAHKMKSTIDSMGIVRLKDVIRVIEANGKQKQNLEQIPGFVKQVDDVLKDCIQQLKQDYSL